MRRPPLAPGPIALLGIALSLAPFVVKAQEATWSRLPVLRGLLWHATALDPARHCVWVFGGSRNGSYINDVFRYSLDAPGRWESVPTTGTPPTPRGASAMVYDAERDRLLIFGGYVYPTGYKNDVWALSLSGTPTWSQILLGGPAPTYELPAAALDVSRDRLLVFGSQGTASAWALPLSGAPEWAPLAASGAPSMPFDLAGILDPVADRLVVSGLVGTPYKSSHLETWSLPLSGPAAWSPLATTGNGPTRLMGFVARYDPTRGRMLLFGGSTTSDSLLWSLSLAGTPTWTQLAGSGATPTPRFGAAVYDPVGDQVVALGGDLNVGDDTIYRPEYHDDAWSFPLFGAPGWQLLQPDSPRPPKDLAGHTLVLETAASRLWCIGGGADPAGSPASVFRLNLGGDMRWQRVVAGGPPMLARYGHSAVLDPARHRILVFGGTAGGIAQNDVWALSLDPPIWTQLTPAGTPPPSQSSLRAVLDTDNDRLLVVGGSNVYALALAVGGSWSQIATSGPTPSPRTLFAVAYDAAGHRVLMQGGDAGGETPSGDTWAFATTGPPGWSLLGTSGPARYNNTLCIDPLRNRVLLMGGNTFDRLVAYDNPSTYETWSMSLSAPGTWHQVSVGGTMPEGRAGHAAVYDAARDRMILLGGSYFSAGLSTDTNVFTDPWALQFTSLLDAPPPVAVDSRLLDAPVPNPARAGTTLRYALATAGPSSLRIVDIQGRLVRALADGALAAGPHASSWDLRDTRGARVPPGLYFCELRSGSLREVRRVVVVR